jgi:ech hydrogenase subunit D
MTLRKDLIQDIENIDASNLLESVADIKSSGYRLGQACATKIEGGIEILYSFEKDETLKNLKVRLPDDAPEIHSVSGIYWPAFIYENEMRDLFGVTFRNLALDYGGHFFKLASLTPWNPARAAQGDADAREVRETDATDDASAREAQNADVHEARDEKGGEA